MNLIKSENDNLKTLVTNKQSEIEDLMVKIRDITFYEMKNRENDTNLKILKEDLGKYLLLVLILLPVYPAVNLIWFRKKFQPAIKLYCCNSSKIPIA
mgnify:CR=1 FL=1